MSINSGLLKYEEICNFAGFYVNCHRHKTMHRHKTLSEAQREHEDEWHLHFSQRRKETQIRIGRAQRGSSQASARFGVRHHHHFERNMV